MRNWLIPALVIAFVIAGLFGGFYSYGPCGTQRVERYQADVAAKLDEWQDAYALAGNTPRVSLTAPIGELQRIQREMAALEAPGCAQEVRDDYQAGMDQYIDALMFFLNEGDDVLVSASIRSGDRYFSEAIVGMVEVSHCAPFCP